MNRIIAMDIINSLTPKAAAKHDPMFNNPTSEEKIEEVRGWVVEQMLMLSSCFKCDQIYKYRRNGFGHTLLCYLSPT